jgi:hypothetical protein
MKLLPFLLVAICLTGAIIPAQAQRDANTSSARAAYSMPSSSYHSGKKKNKNKKIKTKSARKAKKRDTDAARERRRSIGL